MANMDTKSELKVKVVIGPEENQTIKRLVRVPDSYDELTGMTEHRFREHLAAFEISNATLYYYYQDMSYGMINISCTQDLFNAFEYCDMYDLKSLKIYGKSFK